MARDFRRQADAAMDFVAASSRSFDIPTDSVYDHLLLGLEYQSSVGVGQDNSGPFDAAPWTLIKRIELVANGSDTIKSYDGAMLHALNYFDDMGYSPTEDLVITVDSTNTGNIRLQLQLDLASRDMNEPQTTYLDARKLTNIELRITFGAGLADIYTTAQGALDTFRLTPYTHEILDLATESRFSVNEEIMTQESFPANTRTDGRFKQNVANFYRGWVIETRDQNARAVVDRFLKFTVKENGTFSRRVWEADQLKIYASRMYQGLVGIGLGSAPGLPTTATGGPTAGRSGGSRSGLYYLNIAEDGSAESLLNSVGLSDVSIYADWNGANVTDVVRICSRRWVPNVR